MAGLAAGGTLGQVELPLRLLQAAGHPEFKGGGLQRPGAEQGEQQEHDQGQHQDESGFRGAGRFRLSGKKEHGRCHPVLVYREKLAGPQSDTLLYLRVVMRSLFCPMGEFQCMNTQMVLSRVTPPAITWSCTAQAS